MEYKSEFTNPANWAISGINAGGIAACNNTRAEDRIQAGGTSYSKHARKDNSNHWPTGLMNAETNPWQGVGEAAGT